MDAGSSAPADVERKQRRAAPRFTMNQLIPLQMMYRVAMATQAERGGDVCLADVCSRGYERTRGLLGDVLSLQTRAAVSRERARTFPRLAWTERRRGRCAGLFLLLDGGAPPPLTGAAALHPYVFPRSAHAALPSSWLAPLPRLHRVLGCRGNGADAGSSWDHVAE